MFVGFGQFHGLVEGGTGLGGLLGLEVLIAAPAAHPGNDQEREGDDVDRILLPQLFELIATYILVDFIK